MSAQTSQPYNPFRVAQQQLDEAAQLLQLEPAVHRIVALADARTARHSAGAHG